MNHLLSWKSHLCELKLLFSRLIQILEALQIHVEVLAMPLGGCPDLVTFKQIRPSNNWHISELRCWESPTELESEQNLHCNGKLPPPKPKQRKTK